MRRQDTRDQALAWVASNVEEGDFIRSESAFLAVPTIDQALLDACLPALPEALRRPTLSWGRSGTRFSELVDRGPAGGGPIAQQYLERSADLGSTATARYVLQSYAQLPCGREVAYRSLSPLPECYDEVARFSPGVSDCETRYDTFDMFMLPVSAPADVERPGPTVVVHRNGCRGNRR